LFTYQENTAIACVCDTYKLNLNQMLSAEVAKQVSIRSLSLVTWDGVWAQMVLVNKLDDRRRADCSNDGDNDGG